MAIFSGDRRPTNSGAVPNFDIGWIEKGSDLKEMRSAIARELAAHEPEAPQPSRSPSRRRTKVTPTIFSNGR